MKEQITLDNLQNLTYQSLRPVLSTIEEDTDQKCEYTDCTSSSFVILSARLPSERAVSDVW